MRRTILLVPLAVSAACVTVGEIPWQEDEEPPSMALFGSGEDGALHVTTTVFPNACEVLVSASGTSGVAGAPVPVGKLVLVHQVQTAFAISGAATAISATSGAGAWELSKVASADSAGSLVFDPPLAASYATVSTSARAQICTVPQYGSVTIDAGGTLAAAPWDGSTGGVVALLVSSALTLSSGGTIDASAAGFRGGIVTPGSSGGGDVALDDTPAMAGARKGESLDARSVAAHGRGNLGNGGGGGNSFNSGGGGGGNGGRGGLGGKQYSQAGDNPETAGKGGAQLAVFSLLSFGGGGGAGHADDGGGVPGGRGGGAVFVRTRTITGSGVVRADGEKPNLAGDDGGSGGGAGGTIHLLSHDVSTFTGTISAAGGGGGDVRSPMFAGTFAPGGGGGGGIVFLRVPSPAAAANVGGGAAGADLDAADAWGATAGATGVSTVEAPPTE